MQVFPSESIYYNIRSLCVQSLLSFSAPTVSKRHHFLGPQQPSTLLIVILVDANQKTDTFGTCRHPQGVCDENALQGLQQRPTQVVCPESLQVVQLCELDVADDGAQVSGPQQRVGPTEQVKLPLQRLALVGGDSVPQRRLVLQVLCPDTQADI